MLPLLPNILLTESALPDSPNLLSQKLRGSQPARLINYSFFSAGAAGGAGAGVTAGVTAAGAGAGVVAAGAGVVPGAGVAVAGAGIVIAMGASCQWPCSTDHTFPGGASPGG